MIPAISLALLLCAAGANSAPMIPATTPVSYEDSQLTAGRQAYAIQEYELAVTLLKAYLEKKPKDYEGHLYLGMSYRELKRLDDATAALETAVNLRSKSTQVQFELGQTYLAAKKYDAAVKQYQWLEKKDKQLAVEFRLSIPAKIAKQYKLPPSLLDQWQAELDAAQPIYPMSSQLRPTLTYKEKAMYTVEARDKKVQGTVVLSIVFCRNNKLIVVGVVRGLPYGLTESAIEAARKMRFKPAMEDDRPVSVKGNVEFNFTLY